MSGTIAQQIATLTADILGLQAQLAITTDPTAILDINAQISADQAQIATLDLSLCFSYGTHILTERGEVLVEDLKVGDMVVTPHGSAECQPIRWIGRQRYEGQRAIFGQPILVRAGALGGGLPLRDMRLSGDHCLHLDSHLVPVKLLVNGVTIVAETGLAVIEYVNLELDGHAVVFAEGAETETYLDCGNRGRFDNADEPSEWLESRTARDSSAWVDGTAFAPMLCAGEKLDALRDRLANLGAVAAVPGSEPAKSNLSKAA